jgi:glycosyltransferase EpsD
MKSMHEKILFVANVRAHFLFHLPYMKYLKDLGYEVHACANGAGFAGEELLPVCDRFFDLPIARRPFGPANLKAYKALKRLIDDNDYKLISCHTPVGGVLARLAARKARKNGTKVMYTAHGFHFYKGAPLMNWLVYYPIERFCAKYTDVLVTINAEDFALAREKLPVRRICRIHGVGVDSESIRAACVDAHEIRRENGIPQEAVLLISVGELNRNKNHAAMLKAVKILRDRGIDGFFYVICGAGATRDALCAQIEASGLATHVRLLGQREDAIALLKSSDVFLFPSFREGLSKALMEAMAAGLPVVCSRIRGNTDLIRQGEGGLLYRPDDADGFAEGIHKLASDVALRAAMGAANAENVKQYDVGETLREMAEIFSACLG